MKSNLTSISSNSTIFVAKNFFGFIFIFELIKVSSILFELLFIFLVLKTKKKLENVEFWILSSAAAILIIEKAFGFSRNMIENTSGLKSINNYSCIIFFSFSSIQTELYITLLYLSFFHLSMVRRTEWFQKLYKIIRNIRYYAIFITFTFTFLYTLNLLLYFLDQKKQFEFNKKTSICRKKGLNGASIINPGSLIELLKFIPSIIICSNYILSILFLIRNNKKININKQRNKKLLRLAIKFLIFSTLSFCQAFYFLYMIFVTLIGDYEVYFLFFFVILNSIILSIHSLIIIFIHEILKKAFFDFISVLIKKFTN